MSISNRTIEIGDRPVVVPASGMGYGSPVRPTEDGTLKQNLEGRMSRIEGQIRGIRSMAAEGRDCVDVITQIAAVRAALKKVADLMVTEHVEQWVQKTAPNGVPAGQDVEDMLKVFKQYYR